MSSRSPNRAKLAASPEPLVVALARTGDQAAFEELVSRHQAWIRRLMRRCCGEEVLADDLAQQVFLQAWKDLRKLRKADRFPGWLKQLAVNVWRQHARRDDPLKRSDDREIPEVSRSSGTSLALDLDQALADLAPDERLCLVLNYHEGMSHSEIAASTSLPLGTVKSHVRRGAERLKELLVDYSGGGDP